MSLFRFGNIRSPPRRPTIQGSEQSPFRTSPSQLQEITLDPNASAAIPFSGDELSPRKSSEVRHYTVKEYEDHLQQLRKENFYLKLRIFFLENGTAHPNAANNKQDPVEKNVDLEVEAEKLRKEVSEKEYLLCKAAKAFELQEQQHKEELKKITDERNNEKRKMESRIQESETVLKEPKFLQLDSTAFINEVFGLGAANTCVDHHAHEEMEKLKQRIEELEAQVEQMEYTLQQKTVYSNQLEADLQEAQQEAECIGVRCQGLELELQQRNSKLEDLVQELEQRGQDLAGCNLRIRTLEEALSAKEPEIQIKVQELCERDRIIEEKQSQIEQQNKVLVEIQITLDEKQRQIEALRSSLAARDSSIADLEGRLAKAKTNVRNLEAKLDSSVHEANRLREEVTTLKAQQKRINSRNREHAQQELDLLSPVRRRNSNLSSTSDDITSPGRQVLQSAEDNHVVRKRLLELKEKEDKLNNVEESNLELRAQLERVRQEAKALEEKVKQLECGRQDDEHKLQEAEKKMKDKEDKSKKVEEDHLKACQAIKSFMKRTKDMDREINKLKSELKKRDDRICDLMSELNELQDACNKAKWEAHQLQAQAQARVPGSGMPGAFEDVRDMTEEENERLWAEVEDKNRKLAQLTKEKDNLSTEMEKQVQTLLMSRKEDEVLLEEYKKSAATSVRELETRNGRIKELEDDLSQLRKVLETIQVKAHELEENCDREERSDRISFAKESKNSSLPEGLVLQPKDKTEEVERLDGELRKQANNLQELVNKELLDKNREIEKLQDHLNSICERKELEIMSLQQQVLSLNFQLKMFQDKVAELGIHVSFPASHMMKELEQVPVIFNHYVNFQQPSMSGEITVKNEMGDAHREDFLITTVSSNSCAPKDEVSCLRDQLQLSVEERKYLCCKVEELRERLRNTPERDSDSRTLRYECAKLREEIDRANAWRKEAGDASALLTKRLEELAWFLSSLLKHPEQLGGLNSNHRQLLKQAVDQSMELSRSLSVSLSINNPDLTNSCLPPLLDSFSSLLISTSDVNLSITDVSGDEGKDKGEIRCNESVQQENLILSGTSACEVTLPPSSQCFRSSEIAQIQLMKDSATSEGRCASRDKIIGEQAQLIAHLRSQVDTLTHEIRQRDIEFSKSQKDGINMSSRAEVGAVLLEQKNSSTSPRNHSGLSSGLVWKSRIETERPADVEERKDSLSSMTFYNSQHLSSSIGEQWSDDSQTILPPVGDSSVSPQRRALLEAVSSTHQEKHIDVKRSVSSPAETTNAVGEVGVQSSDLVSGRAVLKKQDHSNSTKSSWTMHHSLSTSAIALKQLQQSVYNHDFAAGSLSESEAWSEPDRNVSLARIGLNEESTKAVMSPGTGVSGCSTISTSRPRSGRIIQEETDTSESSEETAHEINRIQGKRGKNDSGEVRRLQNRLRTLEQVNEAMRAELTILHQMAPPLLPSPAEANDKPSAHDMGTNTSHECERKLDKSTSIEHVEAEEGSNGPSVTMSIHLLEQIRYQREKLESSLCHNDFIRRQLEGLMSSLSSEGGDNMMSLWQKMKETAEQLEEARHENQELETRLQEMEVQFSESKEKARLANDVTENLQVTHLTISILQEQISNLESQLQDKDNEILERKCQMLELENQTKQQSIETEKNMQEAVRLKEEAERQIMAAEIMKLEADHKLQEADMIITEAEKAKVEFHGQLVETKKEAETLKLQMKDAEIKSIALETESKSILREKETIQKDKEIAQKERNTIQKEKEIIKEEKKLLQKEKEIMRKEMEEHMKKVESLMHDAKKQKEEAEMQIEAAKKKMQEAEILKQDANRKLKSAEEMSILLEKHSTDTLDMRTKEMEVRLTQQLYEAKKKLQEKECVSKAEMEKKILEAEQLRWKLQTELRTKIEEAQKQEGEIRAEADMRIKNIEERSKEQEMELKKRLQELERFSREKERDLTRQLDEAAVAASQEALERTRLANDKLHLEQELRRHETREAELVRERKDRENYLLVAKEQLEKEMLILQQRNKDLEKCVKELEASNLELKMQLDRLHMTEQPSSPSGGPDSSSSPTHMKAGRTSPASYSSGFDPMTGEGGSLPNSPWGTTATVSMEYNGSQNEDKEQSRDRSRRGSDSGRSEGLTGLSSLVRHALGRQRSELSDYMSEDQGLEEYRAVITQTCSSSYWVRTMAEQHSISSNSVPGDPSLLRNINSSPDLGIESDQGRFSSLEAASNGMQMDTPNIVSTMEGYHSDLDPNLTAVVVDSKCDRTVRTYKELEQENMLLKRRLTKTHHTLEETLAQLMVANQRKKQVERAICKQLHKTHHILKRARINLNAGSVDAVTPSVEKME